MPTATIDEAETAFVRRKFVRSLRLANSILESGSSSDEPACAAADRATGQGRREGQVHDVIVGTDCNVVDDDNVIHCNSMLVPGWSLDELKKNTVANQTETSSSPRSATDPPASTDACTDASSPSWSVRLADESSVYDRAAAIVIQSIYEMDTTVGPIGDGSPGHEVEESRSEHIISDLSTLHRYYSKMTMPIGLACIYIQFCYTIGWRGEALSFALDILGHVFELDAPIQEELISQDWFLDACEELIDLVLTELLPRVQKAEDCKALLQRLMGRKETSDTSHKSQGIAISEEVQPSSIDILVRTLTGTTGSSLSSSFHPCLENIFEQCGENLAKIQSALGASNDTPSGGLDGLTQAADKASARSTAAATDTLDEDAQEDPQVASQSLTEILQSSIVEPLWESEDRWTNRAVVVAVGVSSVLLWRRRKRIGAAVRSTGNAAVAPFREIVEAISQPQGQKR